MNAQLILFLLLGLVFLGVGADLLVRASSRLAEGFGISPVVVGLTLVAFGTSAPEAVVTAGAALSGQAGIAVGNVLGSNIFNVLLILGICAIITPLAVSRRLVRLDVPVMIAAAFVVLFFALDGVVSRGQGIFLFGGIIFYTLFLIRRVPAEAPASSPAPSIAAAPMRPARDLLFVLGGLALLVLGSRWLVSGASGIASGLGVSDLVIGLTVVAAGTSLPELAASAMAAVRGERDIAVGNIVGSNIFNLLFVLGIGSVLAPDGLPIAQETLNFDLPVMIAVCVVCLPLFFTGYTLDRWEGALFLAFYGGYMALLVQRVFSETPFGLSGTMLVFVLPLIVLTLAIAGLRAWKDARAASG